MFSKKGCEVFSHGALSLSLHALPLSSHALLLSLHALQLSFICKHRVAKLNFHYTFIYFHIYIYIYIYIYICCALKKSLPPFIKDFMTSTPILSRTWALDCWHSRISLGISSPHQQIPIYKHR